MIITIEANKKFDSTENGIHNKIFNKLGIEVNLMILKTSTKIPKNP